MWIFGQSTERKRERVIRKEAKALTKQLIEAGMSRQEAKTEMEKLLALVMEAGRQSKAYEKSKSQILFAQMLIEKLTEELFEKESESEVHSSGECNVVMNGSFMQKSIAVERKEKNGEVNQNRENHDLEVRERLRKLTSVLAEVFHECTIREDDTDFRMTCDYFNNVEKDYEGSQRLMLQSELENLSYLLGDILAWKEPDFLALAYFCKFSDKSELGKLSNDQRNEMLLKYYHEQYWNELKRKLSEVGMKEVMEAWINEKLNITKN